MNTDWKSLFGVFFGFLIGMIFNQMIFPWFDWYLKLLVLISGAILGWFFQSYILKMAENYFKKTSAQSIYIIGFGLLFSLLITYLLAVIFKPMLGFLSNSEFGHGVIFLIVFIILMFIIIVKNKEFSSLIFELKGHPNPQIASGKSQLKILDTSSIIDGRIADLCKTGFVEGVLIIPNFVLNELQKIADSPDSLRRNRGRRGLDLLNQIQKENQVTIRIFDRDYEHLSEVDTKLLRLAKELEAKVITNDFNLNKVAELYGVQVLNINELSNAIKPFVLPGEEMMVRILRDGREYGQGIGYLEDGTMIVVEGGKSFIGEDLEILVTSVLQTSAGRMIFAKPKECMLTKVTS